MAEYTIPQKYRDFYVTNPIIELKNTQKLTNEISYTLISDLQNIVLNWYTTSEEFQGTGNKVISFTSQKDGFSVTNDSKTETMKVYKNLSDVPNIVDGWEQGSLNPATGVTADIATVIRTKNFITVESGQRYTIVGSFTTNTYRSAIYEYKDDGTFIQATSLTYLPFTFETNSETSKIKILLHIGSTINITPETVFDEFQSLLVISDEFIVFPNITRIVSTSSFNGLYIESSGPYHGYSIVKK